MFVVNRPLNCEHTEQQRQRQPKRQCPLECIVTFEILTPPPPPPRSIPKRQLKRQNIKGVWRLTLGVFIPLVWIDPYVLSILILGGGAVVGPGVLVTLHLLKGAI